MAQKKDLDYYYAQTRRIAAHREAGAERIIRKIYKHMLKDLQHFVADTYVQYSQNGQLTFAMLERYGYNARYLEEIEQRISVATPKAAQELQQLVEETYEIMYQGIIDGVIASNTIGLDAAFGYSLKLTPETIRAAVFNPVANIALAKNHAAMLYDIKQIVAVGLMNGDRYTTMAQRIAQKIDGGYNSAVRIARTEAHRVREAGNADAALSVDNELKNGTSGLRMVKIWRTMKDERVRPQRRKKGKSGWSTSMGRGANHMIMEGQVVLADELFNLKDGHKTKAPGQSGVAAHDINCRCICVNRMMTDEEFFKATGRHFPKK